MAQQEPIRVLHVVVNMNRGGAETLIMNLYRNIDRAKIQFDFLTCKEGIFDKEIIRRGGKVYRIPYVTDVGHTGFTRQLKRFLIKNSKYKIIHSHMDKMNGLVLRSAKQANVPIRIAHSHNTESEGGFLSKTYKWYAGRHVLPSATHLYACSQAAAKWLFGQRSEEAFILKNGIETSAFLYSPQARHQIRNELGIDNNTLVLGHVGRFCHQKNHMFLLDVFAGLNKLRQDTVLLLAGDGPLKSEIYQKIKDLHIEQRVKLLGIREDVYRLLQAFDLFVFPSYHEGLPVTLIEAQGAGLPCVISNNITNEVDMGVGLVQYLPITNKNIWINHILNIAEEKTSRIVSQEALNEKGYDIRETARTTQRKYLTLLEEVEAR